MEEPPPTTVPCGTTKFLSSKVASGSDITIDASRVLRVLNIVAGICIQRLVSLRPSSIKQTENRPSFIISDANTQPAAPAPIMM